MEKVKQYMYYFVIGVVSLVALLFLPMIGSSVGLGWNIPNTVVGWIVWVAVKVIVATLNVLIFHSFMRQAILNVKNDERYKAARDILITQKVKNVLPRSPEKWNKHEYGRKGTMIFITTALATVALTQAILSFDWVSMLTYLFTIIMGLIFGVLQMKKAEEYWTDEYYRYAIYVRDVLSEAQSRVSNDTPEATITKVMEEYIENANVAERAISGHEVMNLEAQINNNKETNNEVSADIS